MRVLLICGVILAFTSSVLSVPKCDGTWTDFYDDDNPDGPGDVETLSSLRKKYPTICANPTGIDVRLVQPLDDGVDYWYVGGNDIKKEDMGPHIGFQCFNSNQKGREVPHCKDYKIRFCCKFIAPPVPECDGTWTRFYDDDNAKNSGDHETLDRLTKKYREICSKPSAVDVRLVHPVRGGADYWKLGGNVIKGDDIGPHVGFRCLNANQRGRPVPHCKDYKIRFCCSKAPPVPECDGTWTRFYDDDNARNSGDHETLDRLTKKYREICSKPSAVDVRLVHPVRGGADYWKLGGNVIKEEDIGPHVGFRCLNANQRGHGVPHCKDYKIRFCCSKDIVSGWTGWFNVDKPSVGGGDFETISNIKMRKRSDQRFCRSTPKKIVVVRAKDHKDPRKLGQSYYAHPRYGFKCYNSKQRSNRYSYAPAVCFDYKVKFFC